MSAHTPGPWAVESTPAQVWVTNGKRAVASIPVLGECAKADAQLISAAPDLLAALEAVVEWADACGWSETKWARGVERKANAAIAKAKGETP